MKLNFETAFAEDAVKSNIDESDWKLGWVQIVGGINGVPTAQQFNEVCFIADKKANVAYGKAIEALSAAQSAGISLEQAINDISAALNVKADKSEIPTYLPANGGDSDTVDGKHASDFAAANHSHEAGDIGAITNIKIGTVTTGAAGSSAAATVSTNGTETTLNLTIPKGDTGAKGATGAKGDKGDTGATPTVKVAAGSNIGSVGTPSVTAAASGTTTTLTFNYLKGAKGDKGDTGATGAKGATGATGPQGPAGPNVLKTGTVAPTTSICPSGYWYGKY